MGIDLIKLTVTEEGTVIKNNVVMEDLISSEASERISGHMKVVAQVIYEELKGEIEKESDDIQEAIDALAELLQEMKKGAR